MELSTKKKGAYQRLEGKQTKTAGGDRRPNMDRK
jgi:hypothetical protein